MTAIPGTAKPRIPKTGCAVKDTHAGLAAAWSERNEYAPGEVSGGSGYIAWWKCLSQPSHPEWPAAVRNRTGRKSGCPRCWLEPAPGESLGDTHHHLVSSWSSDNELTPYQVSFGTDQGVLWVCVDDPSHSDWTARIGNRVRGTGCPECWETKRGLIPEGSSLNDTHPELAAQSWHVDNILSPIEVKASDRYRVKWRCSAKPLHPDWWATVRSRAVHGTGCWRCSFEPNPGESVADLNPDLVAAWHSENARRPEDVTQRSPYRAKWKCLVDAAHPDWEATVFERAVRGTGCADCALERQLKGTSVAEKRLRDEFAHRFTGVHWVGKRLPRRSGGHWVCDIVIESPYHPTVVVEYDGEYWHGAGSTRGVEKQREWDMAKANDLRAQGHVVVRVQIGKLECLHPHDVHIAKRLYDDASHIVEVVTARLGEMGVQLTPSAS